MKTATLITIETILEADRSIPRSKREKVMDILLDRNPPPKPRLGTKKQVAEILDCSTRTIDRYVRDGILSRTEFSKRQHRYDLNQVEAYARGEGVNK